MANSGYNIDATKRNYDTGTAEPNISSAEDAIKSIYNTREVLNVSDNHVEYNSGICTSGNITVADILNLSSIRGGSKMSCGCGMTGGCITCKNGVKNITHIYKTVHIIIPELYEKYNNDVNKKKASKGKKNKGK